MKNVADDESLLKSGWHGRRFATGIPGIDSQHRELRSRIDGLEEGLKRKDPPGSIRASVAEFLERVENHFTAEEYLMEMVGFPRAAAHKRVHGEILNQLAQTMKGLEYMECAKACRLIRIFRDVAGAHISADDGEYAVFIANLIVLREKFSITALGARAIAG